MKKYYLVITGIVVITISILTGCNKYQGKKLEDAKENVKMAGQDLKDVQAENETEWHQFKNNAELKINDNEKRIDEYNAEIKTTGEKIKVKYEKEVGLLELKNKALKKKMNDYKYESKKWDEFRQRFNHDLDALSNELTNIFAKNN